jgi:acylaminoacyl-peptidase
VRNLYLLNIKTNTTEALTEPSYETSDSEPFFLDNDHIAYFHHHNDQVDQLYVLNLANRASYPLTDFPIAFGNLKYNAEHQLLAFSAAVYADGTLEGAARKDKEIEETKKDSAMVFDELMVR